MSPNGNQTRATVFIECYSNLDVRLLVGEKSHSLRECLSSKCPRSLQDLPARKGKTTRSRMDFGPTGSDSGADLRRFGDRSDVGMPAFDLSPIFSVPNFLSAGAPSRPPLVLRSDIDLPGFAELYQIISARRTQPRAQILWKQTPLWRSITVGWGRRIFASEMCRCQHLTCPQCSESCSLRCPFGGT